MLSLLNWINLGIFLYADSLMVARKVHKPNGVAPVLILYLTNATANEWKEVLVRDVLVCKEQMQVSTLDPCLLDIGRV